MSGCSLSETEFVSGTDGIIVDHTLNQGTPQAEVRLDADALAEGLGRDADFVASVAEPVASALASDPDFVESTTGPQGVQGYSAAISQGGSATNCGVLGGTKIDTCTDVDGNGACDLANDANFSSLSVCNVSDGDWERDSQGYLYSSVKQLKVGTNIPTGGDASIQVEAGKTGNAELIFSTANSANPAADRVKWRVGYRDEEQSDGTSEGEFVVARCPGGGVPCDLDHNRILSITRDGQILVNHPTTNRSFPPQGPGDLDVNGEVRAESLRVGHQLTIPVGPASGNPADCSSELNGGALRYDSANHVLEVCDWDAGASMGAWRAL